LACAALLFAREIAYPDLRPSTYLAQLDDWAVAVRDRLTPGETVSSQVDQLVRYLFEDLGLRGNSENYGDPRNSYLNEVMSRRVGLPISLSVIFLEVAQRLGLPAEGVGLPGHFLVAVRLPGFRLLLDPFNRGESVSAEEAARLVRQSTGFEGPLQKEWFEPASPEAIVARMLFNLRGVFVQSEAWPEAMAVVQHLIALQPDEADHLRDLGLLHARGGSKRTAAGYLEKYLMRRPEAKDADLIRQSLNGLVEQLARLN
jgi:regulator of sirC expression with transglutaminase-like and TPR domain